MSMNTEPDGEIITLEDLCEWLKIAPSTVYRHLYAGKLPGFKVGRHWRFSRESIETWVREQEKVSKTAIYPRRVKP